MRAIPLLLAMFLAVYAGACGHGNPAGSSATAPGLATLSFARSGKKPDFETQIKPIFQARCQPCHFSGGRVYDKMPFDKPETITRLGTKLFYSDQRREGAESDQGVPRATLATNLNYKSSPDVTVSIEIDPPSNPSTGRRASAPGASQNPPHGGGVGLGGVWGGHTPLSEFIMKCRRPGFIDAELHYRNICPRKNVTEYRPRSVIQSPAFIQLLFTARFVWFRGSIFC